MSAAPDRVTTWSMLVLSFGTGGLDAATYLGLHGVFTANMTGNVVFVGLGVAQDASVPLLRAGLALGGFVLGAAVVGLVQRGRDARPDADGVAGTVFLLAGLLLASTAWFLHRGGLDVLTLDLLTGGLGFAMGAQAVAARRVGVGDVSTVVVTSTIAGFAAEAPWVGRRADGATTLRRLGAVLSMGAGAVAGAFLLRVGVGAAVALSAGLLLLVGTVGLWRAGRIRLAERRRRGGARGRRARRTPSSTRRG